MRKLHLSMFQLETQQELEEAIREILDLPEEITDRRLAPKEEDNQETPAAMESQDYDPFQGRILWSS